MGRSITCYRYGLTIVQLLKQVNYILASNHEFLFATFIKWNFAFTSEYPWPKQDS